MSPLFSEVFKLFFNTKTFVLGYNQLAMLVADLNNLALVVFCFKFFSPCIKISPYYLEF